MRLLLDENVDARLQAHLIAEGHDVTHVIRDYTRSLADANILSIAVREQRVLVTNDRDFGSIVFRENQAHSGVIYMRLRNQAFVNVRDRVAAAIALEPDEGQMFLVVTDRRIRTAGQVA